MDITMVTELIASLGFPIAVAIALGWFVFKIYKKSEEREDRLMDEISENRQINAQAIETITKYASSLEVIQSDINEIKADVNIIMNR